MVGAVAHKPCSACRSASGEYFLVRRHEPSGLHMLAVFAGSLAFARERQLFGAFGGAGGVHRRGVAPEAAVTACRPYTRLRRPQPSPQEADIIKRLVQCLAANSQRRVGHRNRPAMDTAASQPSNTQICEFGLEIYGTRVIILKILIRRSST